MTEKNQDFGQMILSLEKTVAALEERTKSQNSLRRNFSISIMRGLGSAIGATVIFGLFLAGLVQIIRSINYVPVVNNILSSKAIEDIINRFTQF